MKLDYITINTEDGTKVQAELVAKFELKDMGEYVLYKIGEDIYGARYEEVDGKTNLVTDLTEFEQRAINDTAKTLGVE